MAVVVFLIGIGSLFLLGRALYHGKFPPEKKHKHRY